MSVEDWIGGEEPDEDHFVDADFVRLEADVQGLLVKWADTEKRLRNLANELERHKNEPDAHNPGMLRRHNA